MIAFSCPKCKSVVTVCNIPSDPPVTAFACVSPTCNYHHNSTNYKITIQAPDPAPEPRKEPKKDGTV